MSTRGLRLLVYDSTCTGGPLRPGLSDVWLTGTWLYRALGRIDHARGITSWGEALTWLAEVGPGQRIAEVQYWGHGKWGQLLADRELLDRSSLRPDSAYAGQIAAIRDRLADDALLWFRTCETFGAAAGHDFARAVTDTFGCAAAGHTFIIAYWQSGLHRLRPGGTPQWPAEEGLSRGSATSPERARHSTPAAPNTVTCLQGEIPAGY